MKQSNQQELVKVLLFSLHYSPDNAQLKQKEFIISTIMHLKFLFKLRNLKTMKFWTKKNKITFKRPIKRMLIRSIVKR